jgi:hypothetical protein
MQVAILRSSVELVRFIHSDRSGENKSAVDWTGMTRIGTAILLAINILYADKAHSLGLDRSDRSNLAGHNCKENS